jgi:PAS domain S-box-containing protein
LRILLTPMRDREGNVRGCQAAVEDITEQKEMDQALHESEQRYRSFVQNFRGIAYRSGMDFVPLFFHGSVEEITGYTEGEFLEGKPRWDQVIHPEDSSKLFTENKERLHAVPHYSYEREYRIVRKDGMIRWVHEVIQNVCDDSGNPAMVEGAIYDITDRKAAEAALEESEQRFRDLYKNLRDGVAAVDERGRFVRCNPQFLDMLGYTFEEIAELTYQEITPARWHAMQSRILQGQVDTRGYSDLYEKEYIHKNGTVFPVEIQTYLVKDRDGRNSGYWAFVRDITDRKKAEDKIAASLDEKVILLREIHHRVKNNLAVVNSLLRLQSKDAKDEFHRQMFSDAQDRIRSIALAHERLYETENLAYVNMSQYVASLIDHLLLTDKGIGFMVRVNKDVEEVQLGLDKTVPLGFLINELVSNALRHAYPNHENGSIDVSLRTTGENELELTVKDDGVGMPESVDFEDPKSLGLRLVKLFTRQLEGEIELVRDGGTEFRIRFGEDSPSGKEQRNGKGQSPDH